VLILVGFDLPALNDGVPLVEHLPRCLRHHLILVQVHVPLHSEARCGEVGGELGIGLRRHIRDVVENDSARNDCVDVGKADVVALLFQDVDLLHPLLEDERIRQHVGNAINQVVGEGLVCG